MLQTFLKIASIPHIANGDFFEIVKTFKVLLSNSNVVVVTLSVKCLGALGQGLRQDFLHVMRPVASVSGS